MALTLIARPQDITPAYNPVKWIIDSNIKNYEGFRYVFKVKDGSSNIIAEYRLIHFPPLPLPQPQPFFFDCAFLTSLLSDISISSIIYSFYFMNK